MRRWFVLVMAVLTFFVLGAAPGGATSSGVSTVEDATGDSTHLVPGSTDLAPYMDLVSARVQQRKEGTLFFLELAGAIPDTPTETSLIWVFHLETNPGPPGPSFADHVPRVLWNGSSFVGQVLHRFTTATGGLGTSITPGVPFEIKGGTVRLTVDPDVLGNPSSFKWNAATRPSAGVPYSDHARCENCLDIWTAK